MIRTIQSIKNFGVFSDFRWPAGLPEFKKFNLLYGWNYSGKTTLSRVFRCFERKQPHPDFLSAQVQLKAEDGAVHELSAPDTVPVLRVFNTDYVRENLSFDNGCAEPILVVGAEAIEKQEMLKVKKAEHDSLLLSLDSSKKEKSEKEQAIERALTKYARDFIKNPLAVPNYDKTRFEPVVIECKDAPASYLLDNSTFAQWLSVFNATEKKPALSTAVGGFSSIAQLREQAAALLARVVTATNPIPRLKDNPAIESWVKEGRPLHEGKTTCQFCDQPLPGGLLSELAEHFSADYDDLMTALRTLRETIQSAQKEHLTLPHRSEFYVELQERFGGEKSQLDELLKIRDSSLAVLRDAVVAKETKAFAQLECPFVDDPTEEIGIAIEAVVKTIAEHNNRTAEFEKKRQEAFAKLEKHYAALFVREEQYNETLQKIADLTATVAEQDNKLRQLGDEIRDIEKAVSEVVSGAEQINEFLVAFFGTHHLCLQVTADKKFQIARGDVVAKNLSEGEKNAIAFAHFMTRLADNRHPLSDTIVVIDDPICSLDANHIFNTYALIKTRLADCRQLFIATHSFEFYDLIRDWVSECENGYETKAQANWKQWSIFHVRRTDAGDAVLEEIPKMLLRFKSEYHYLFSTLYHLDRDGTDFDSTFRLPNVVRRFMEAFAGIMIPRKETLKSKMPRLFPDVVERERVLKFINHYSHNRGIMRSLAIPDLSECKAVVHACLKAVEDWDKDYFNDLKAEVGS